MKKAFFITLGLAILFGLSACVDPQDLRYDPSQTDGHESVVTKFFLNVSMGNSPETKQYSSDVQVTGDFRGIDDATLFAFSLRNPSDSTQLADGGKVLSPYTKPLQMYNLSTLFPKGTFTRGADKNNRMFEISLPTGTNALIFYAKAYRETKTSTTGNLDNDEVYGKLEYTAPTLDGRTDDLTIIGSKAAPRLNDSNKQQYTVMKNIILGVLNHLLRVGFNATGTDSEGWDNAVVDSVFGVYNLHGRAIHWYDYKASAAKQGKKSPLNAQKDASELEIMLGDSYVALTTIDVPEIRSGAGSAIERQIGDLYSILSAAEYSGAKNDEERVALVMINRIKTNITYFFDIDPSTGDATWKSPKDVVRAISTYYHYTVDTSTTTGSAISSSILSEFPREFHIPFGGASLIIDQSDDVKNKPYAQYAYNDEKINLTQVYYNKDTTASFYIGVNDYTYTPELCYYCNAPIHTTKTVPTEASFDVTVANWPDFSKWGSWASTQWEENSHVVTATRGVALANNVHYGVSLLKSQVKFDVATLNDNNAALHSTSTNPETDKIIPLGANANLTWTGILIAGQPDKVGWYYMAVPDTNGNGSKFNKMVYDKVNYINDDEEGYDVPVDLTATPSNYTLLFDNYNPNVADTAQNTVFVALEFRNDLGVDFWGNANLVRQGGIFYIIGVMQPHTLADDWWNNTNTEYNMLPPYDADGKTKHISRVFMQNCITNATFHIGQNSLKRAFTTVPDLRTARLSLGLSVDLSWNSASSYDIVLGQ